MKERDRYEMRALFRKHFNLTDEDDKRLCELWMMYGNSGIKSTPGGHYFIQEIIEHNFVDWKMWKRKLHPELLEIIKNEFPQLMVTFKEFQD